ncbi:MAG: S9 family peptidase, partial [Pseudonocardiaceae bacterium]
MSAPTLTPPVAGSVFRSNFSFAPDGQQATCLRIDDHERTLELWSCRSLQAHGRLLRDIPAIAPATQALPLRDGQVLLHPNATDNPEEKDKVYLLDPRRREVRVRELGTLLALGSYLLPSPSRTELAFIVSYGSDHSTIWCVNTQPAGLTPLLQLPGVAAGGLWLDAEAGLLGLNLTEPDRGTDGVLVDLARGAWTRFFSISKASNDCLVAYSPSSRLLAVSTNARGADRLGLNRLDTRNALHFPDTLNRDGFPRQALTFDETGERLLLHEDAGAISSLLGYTPAGNYLTTLHTPPGTIGPQASWSQGIVRVPFSGPTTPLTLLSVAADGNRRPEVALLEDPTREWA